MNMNKEKCEIGYLENIVWGPQELEVIKVGLWCKERKDGEKKATRKV